jgi:hypothetical protein
MTASYSHHKSIQANRYTDSKARSNSKSKPVLDSIEEDASVAPNTLSRPLISLTRSIAQLKAKLRLPLVELLAQVLLVKPEDDVQVLEVDENAVRKTRHPECETGQRTGRHFHLERAQAVVDRRSLRSDLLADLEEGIVAGLCGGKDELVDGVAEFRLDSEEVGLPVEGDEGCLVVGRHCFRRVEGCGDGAVVVGVCRFSLTRGTEDLCVCVCVCVCSSGKVAGKFR